MSAHPRSDRTSGLRVVAHLSVLADECAAEGGGESIVEVDVGSVGASNEDLYLRDSAKLDHQRVFSGPYRNHRPGSASDPRRAGRRRSISPMLTVLQVVAQWTSSQEPDLAP